MCLLHRAHACFCVVLFRVVLLCNVMYGVVSFRCVVGSPLFRCVCLRLFVCLMVGFVCVYLLELFCLFACLLVYLFVCCVYFVCLFVSLCVAVRSFCLLWLC